MTYSDTLLQVIRRVKRDSIQINILNLGVIKNNLKFVHDACVASEQLLIDAASQIRIENEFMVSLKCYYEDHLEEERGEISLLRDDLEYAGVGVYYPDPIAMAMIGTQYYLIKHQHPISLLGYMAVVEADPPALSEVEQLEKLYGEKMFRSLRMHAIKDMEHRKELVEVIDLAPEVLHGFISTSAELSLRYLKEAALNYGRTK